MGKLEYKDVRKWYEDAVEIVATRRDEIFPLDSAVFEGRDVWTLLYSVEMHIRREWLAALRASDYWDWK